MKNLISAILLCGLGSAAVVEAQGVARVGRVTGLSVTPTAVVGTDVDFDIELATTSLTGTTPASNAYGVGFIGDFYQVGFFSTFFSSYVNFAITMLDPDLAAIRYNGTGTTTQAPVEAATLPLFATGAPNRFRGSFSTTYPAPGAYTLQVEAVNRANLLAATTVSTGTPLVLPAGSPVQVYIAQTYTNYPGSNTYFTTSATFSSNALLGARAIASLNLTGAGGGPNPLEIPTLGQASLIALASALAIAAVMLLRR